LELRGYSKSWIDFVHFREKDEDLEIIFFQLNSFSLSLIPKPVRPPDFRFERNVSPPDFLFSPETGEEGASLIPPGIH
jgi:hypothetical protein